MNPREIEENLNSMIDKHYNTYCYTKNLFEKKMNMCFENLPCCIVRPSMVGPSYKQPFPGWVDTLAAVGGVIFFGGLGIMTYTLGTGE